MAKSSRFLKSIMMSFFLLFSSNLSWGMSYTDSWIFHSEVAPNQTVWGTNSTGYNYGDTYEARVGPLVAGFGWELQADPGIVSGNVQGNISATYDKIMKGLGTHTISLNYAGQENESQIGTNLGVKLKANPYVGLDVPIIGFNAKLGIDAVDIDVNIKKDYTTGLDTTVKDSAHYNALAFNADVLLISGDLNFYVSNDIAFTPETISGIMKYRFFDMTTMQFDPLSEKAIGITIEQDISSYDYAVDMDRPGMWEFTLEDFSLTENMFNQKLGLGAEIGIGVPILSAELKADIDLGVSFGGGSQELDFLSHGYDGDNSTPDILGRWCVYVDPVPVPGTLILLASGLLGVTGVRRRKN